MTTQGRITLDPQVLVGKPAIRGTRIAVDLVLELLARGWTETQILDQYPGLERAFRRGLPAACGIVLFRIGAQDPTVLAHRVVNVLHSHANGTGQFASVDEARIRVRPLADPS